MSATETRPRIGPVQVGVILLALAAGIIHLYLFLIEGFLAPGLGYEIRMLVFYQVLFVANFLAFVTLAAALYLPISLLARFRPVVRVLLIAITVATIVSYFYVGVFDLTGNITQVIEILLVVLVTVDAGMSDLREELAGR